TWDYDHRDAGGYWFFSNWGRTSKSKVVNDGSPASQTMPVDWNWTYQLNQYELPDSTSKRMAWGSNFGAIGKGGYDAYGSDKTLSGWPYRSRSVYYVLGAKSDDAVARRVTSVEASLRTALSAAHGKVRTQGPAGVGRTDEEPYAPTGWNSVYGTWDVD